MNLKIAIATFVLTSNVVSNAQTWQVEGSLTNTFQGCSRMSSGGVKCVMTSTYTGEKDEYSARMSRSDASIITGEGKQIYASSLVAGGINPAYLTLSYITRFREIPLKMEYTFDYPKSYSTIRRLIIGGSSLDNVSIRNSSTTSNTAPTSTGVNLGKTQAVVQGKAFTINLTNCKSNSGTYTCSATVIPAY